MPTGSTASCSTLTGATPRSTGRARLTPLRWGINDAGQIVGEYLVPGIVHGFLLDVDGSYTALDVPGAIQTTVASGINNAGVIVGYWYDVSFPHGFLATPAP